MICILFNLFSSLGYDHLELSPSLITLSECSIQLFYIILKVIESLEFGIESINNIQIVLIVDSSFFESQLKLIIVSLV